MVANNPKGLMICETMNENDKNTRELPVMTCRSKPDALSFSDTFSRIIYFNSSIPWLNRCQGIPHATIR